MVSREDKCRTMPPDHQNRTSAEGDSHPSLLVTRALFVPPRLRSQFIERPRLDRLLARATDYSLTLLKAEAGFGKTIAAASFVARTQLPYVWYSLGDTGADLLTFLVHLIHAFREKWDYVGEKALALLGQRGGAMRWWVAVVDLLINDLLETLDEDTLLVLDDYCNVVQSEIHLALERLIEHRPPHLHVVITSRTTPSLPGRVRWRVSGEMLVIDSTDLAFTADEIATLFEQRFQRAPSQEMIAVLQAETEGWPIALHLLTQTLRDLSPPTLDDLLHKMPGPLDLLFQYLAQEVLYGQPTEIRRFLSETAILRRLESDACDYVLERGDSAEVLSYLSANSLFVIQEGDYRYHHLFRDFLLKHGDVSAERRSTLHLRAATFYRTRHNHEEEVYHLLAAGEYTLAAETLTRIARSMVYSGRHYLLANWIDSLPAEVSAAYPDLLLARGHAHRFASRFREALDVYQRAYEGFQAQGKAGDQVRALLGMAMVYLDTVQPVYAEPLLLRALRLVEREDKSRRAQLLVMLAENKLNMGDLLKAERLHRAVYRAVSEEDIPAMDPRLYLRDGRFARARQMVEGYLQRDPWGMNEARAPRSHREPAVLLAWIDAMTGRADSARTYANQAVKLGRTLQSPIVECVALSRLGHAWLCGDDFDIQQAEAYYRASLAVAAHIDVPRFTVESHLGLTLIAGQRRDVAVARASADEALRILDETGDGYMTAVVNLALGIALTLSRHPEAGSRLREAVRRAEQCGDRFGPCAGRLWLALRLEQENDAGRAREELEIAFRSMREHGFDFLVEAVPLFGVRDEAVRNALLEQFRSYDAAPRFRGRHVHLSPAHPGIPLLGDHAALGSQDSLLYIQTLGPFRVRYRNREIERSAWQRTKVLHLLQFLVCKRGRRTHREHILDALWPDSTPQAAAIGLRVALSLLRKALAEPQAEAGEALILREGELLQLNLAAGIRVDVDDFLRLVSTARATAQSERARAISLFEQALGLYRGDFLEEQPYAEWAQPERSQLLNTYLASIEEVTRLLVEEEEYDRAKQWANLLIAREPLWEEAYYLLMVCHWRLGNRALAVRAYERCCQELESELGVEPSPHVRALFEQILAE
ncbi:MAG: hypothetical protein D6791_08710 [Chloroflexi bacterium]|nr:MAG: hypothetical protein D6791_08710 [Chloroflexota bacterium]